MTVLQEITVCAAAARKEYAERLTAAQAACPHLHVGHYTHSEPFVDHPIRICLECGVEEEGSWWCGPDRWNRKGFKKPEVLGDKEDRFVKEVSSEAFHKIRRGE
jgi:hypothetical protein